MNPRLRKREVGLRRRLVQPAEAVLRRGARAARVVGPRERL